MATAIGSQILARALRRLDLDTMFYLMGGPMLAAESACIEEGIRSIDVRHEQAAAMMAHAYGRVLNKVGVCMAASGPATMNLVTGVSNAWADAAPLLAIGGASPVSQFDKGAFQEMDQLSVFKPITKWAERVYDARRIPELVALAVRQALDGAPGPVYLDMPGDVLYREVDEDSIKYPDADAGHDPPPPAGDPAQVEAAIALLEKAERPIIITGGGVLWSGASDRLRQWVDSTGIPFYTTPQGRGVVPDDHELSFLTARSTAFREADLALVIGTRINYVIGYLSPPRFNAAAKLIQIDINPQEIGHNHPADVGLVGDAGAILDQLLAAADGRLKKGSYSTWTSHLRAIDEQKTQESEAAVEQRLDADPPAAALQGGPRLPGSRRDPGGRRPGDPELRPPVDPHLRAGPPAQLGAVRHDGRRPAVRARRQGGQAGQAGAGAARRRLVRPERDGARHGRALEAPGRHRRQPERRLDGRSGRQQARPRPWLHAATTRWPRRSAVTPSTSRSRPRSDRPWSGRTSPASGRW